MRLGWDEQKRPGGTAFILYDRDMPLPLSGIVGEIYTRDEARDKKTADILCDAFNGYMEGGASEEIQKQQRTIKKLKDQIDGILDVLREYVE